MSSSEAGARLRLLTFEDYGISAERCKELKHFCLQYDEKKRIASWGTYGLHGVNYSKLGPRGGLRGSPTEAAALRNVTRQEHARRDCERIEEAARWAAKAGGYADGWKVALLSVTEGLNFEALQARGEFIPWTRTDFYAVKRALYYWLDELQHGGGSSSDD